ncbi:hypothetical protein CEP53_007675 [Fusarium sp. AF-6]|nr:hypothetical protein CEP53_007675 [Fusarium sp. AF-6]
MPFTTTDNDQLLYYETSGDSDPTIVFVPGYMGIAEIWRPVLSRLPEDAASYSIERRALDLKSLLTALDINKPVILVTHSMGCNIAPTFCLSNSAQVRGMVQVGAHHDGKQLAEAGYTVGVLCTKSHIPSETMGFYMKSERSKDVAIKATKGPAYARRDKAHALLSLELRDRAKEISVPALVIQGGK